MGRFLAFPKHAGGADFDLTEASKNSTISDRLKRFGGDRSPVFYDDKLQKAHHIHFPAREQHRVLQHHYGESIFYPSYSFIASYLFQKFSVCVLC
jgi:hypothetical protein